MPSSLLFPCIFDQGEILMDGRDHPGSQGRPARSLRETLAPAVVSTYMRKQPGTVGSASQADTVISFVEIVKRIRLDDAHRLLDAWD